MLDEDHQRLVRYLDRNYPRNGVDDSWAMNEKTGFIGTYFRVLKASHRDLNLAGPFEPVESGHCIAFPLEGGGWVVVSTTTDREYLLGRESETPDSFILRSLKPLGPVTAAEAIQRLPALAGMTPHELGLKLRRLKDQPIQGMSLLAKPNRNDCQVWWVEGAYGWGHPDAPLLQALRQLGPVTAAEALRHLGLETTAQSLGARLRSIRLQGPIDGLALRREGRRWRVESAIHSEGG